MTEKPAPHPGPKAHAGHREPPAPPPSAPASLPTQLKLWLKLVRIEHALLSAFGVSVGILLAQKTAAPPAGCLAEAASAACAPLAAPLSTWLHALAVPLLINIGAFALNDYLDIEADRRNGHHSRPLVSGALSPRMALATGVAGLGLGALVGWLLNPTAGAIGTLFALLSVAYNRRLKDMPLVGNVAIALSMAVAFVFGSAALGLPLEQTSPILILLSLGASAAGLGREIVKTVQDMEGDKAARGSKSLPHVVGARPSLQLAAVCFAAFGLCVLALLLTPSALAWNTLSIGLLLIALAVFGTMAALLARGSAAAERLEAIRSTSLYALGLCLGGLLAAAI